MLEHFKRLKTISDTGLLYSNNEYDLERYKELAEISLTLLSKVSDHSIEQLKLAFPIVADHPTAKVDVRALIVSEDQKILLVRESSDEKWSLPGGWAEIGHSPSETVIKECKEETGIDVEVEKLLAVFDKKKHAHPPQASYVYKMVFHCTSMSTAITKGFDVLDVQYFSINNLPELSENRILKSQIEMVYDKVMRKDWQAWFD